MQSELLPEILLVEDDPTTRSYLVTVSAALPARVDTVATVAEAIAHAHTRLYALWLIDANLPDGNGVELLTRLRARSATTPALAHTAAHDQAALQALRGAGFLDVLTKPADPHRWQAALRMALDLRTTPAPASIAASTSNTMLPLWDDAAAARALAGNAANITALRRLFLAELPVQLAQIRDGDQATCLHHLHRLHASCAFVGAQRLEAAARALHTAPDDDRKMQIFSETAQATLLTVAKD